MHLGRKMFLFDVILCQQKHPALARPRGGKETNDVGSVDQRLYADRLDDAQKGNGAPPEVICPSENCDKNTTASALFGSALVMFEAMLRRRWRPGHEAVSFTT